LSMRVDRDAEKDASCMTCVGVELEKEFLSLWVSRARGMDVPDGMTG